MNKDLIKEVFVVIVGKQAAEIIEFIDEKKFVNEFLIAKKMDLTVNQVRNILYRLSDHSLVSSMRKKDKRKGWYTYFWKVEDLKSLESLKSLLMKKIEQLKSQIKSRETKNFYVCERCNLEFNEENAMLYDFTCNECGDIFVQKDNSKILNEFNKHVDKLSKKLALVNEEMKSVVALIEKKRAKEILKEQKEKAAKRKATRKKNVETKAVKKTAKKKVAKKKTAKKKVAKKKTSKKAVKKKSTKKKTSKKK